MARRLAAFGVLLAVAVVAAGCGGGSEPAPTTPTALPGTSWELGLQGGTAPAARTLPTLSFAADGTVSGFTGCQPYGARYTSTGTAVAITDIVLTPTTNECAPSTKESADAFVAALAGATAWRVETVMPTQGVEVLQPVKLMLDGATPLVFTLQ
jgi:heat shock protein HslJ